MSRIHPPAGVTELVSTLEKAGFETWCVGGAVRDGLMGRVHLDWDLATAATPEQVQRLFRRTIPVGIKFGTVGVLDRAGRMHEVTTFRRDLETDGRHAVVHFGASLDEDLARRDFTINAIAYSPTRDLIHDPFDGQGDLERRILRTVGTPADRMREDRLRALRALRFATRFHFAIADDTWAAIRDSASHLTRLSPERVRQELEKTMEQVERPSEAMRLWEESGAFASLVPALVGAPPVRRAAIDFLAMPGNTRRPRRRLDRLTAMFVPVPVDALGRTLRDLRFSNSEAAWIAHLVGAWQAWGLDIAEILARPDPIEQRIVRTWAARIGRTRVEPFFRLASAVWCAEREEGRSAPSPRRVREAYRLAAGAAYRDPIEISDLAVDGEDLIAAGVKPGPAIGAALKSLMGIVLDDPVRNTREQLLEAARALSRTSTPADT